MKILLVEDDPTIVYGLRKFLELDSWHVTVAFSMQEAERCLDNTFDLFILDVGLPDGDGFQVCQQVRCVSNAPIIFLTAQDDEASLLRGFDLGADDYITKPFRLAELKRRILAITKRSNSGLLAYGSLTIDVNAATVRVDNNEVQLSVQEYRLLLILFKHRGELVLRDALNKILWENDTYITDNALSVNIKRLREKMGPQIEIKTVHGKGYILHL